MEVVLIQVSFVTIGSRQKKKIIKMILQNIMASSYHSKFGFTQSMGAPFFSCLGYGIYYYIYKFFLIIATWKT